MPARRGLSHAVVLLAMWLALASDAAAATQVRQQFFGANLAGEFLVGPDRRDTALAPMRAGGLSFGRSDAAWESESPSSYDGLVADLARNQLRWYPVLGYSASWAASVAGDRFSPPASDRDFADFARALAARYGAAGSFWESRPDLPRLPVIAYE